jgi:hypothetical protein
MDFQSCHDASDIRLNSNVIVGALLISRSKTIAPTQLNTFNCVNSIDKIVVFGSILKKTLKIFLQIQLRREKEKKNNST